MHDERLIMTADTCLVSHTISNIVYYLAHH